MGAKMEVLPNSLLKRRGSSTATWGGGTLGRVGGRRRRLRRIRSTIFTTQVGNNIKQSSLLVGHPHHQLLTQEEVSSIQASTTMSSTMGNM